MMHLLYFPSAPLLVSNAPAMCHTPSTVSPAAAAFLDEVVSHLKNKAMDDDQCLHAIRACIARVVPSYP